MMTGTIGFIVGALAVGCFAATANRAYTAVDRRKLQLFTFAFGLLAAAMLLWGIAAGFGSSINISEIFFATDALLMIATASMGLILLDSSSNLYLFGFALIGSLSLALRAFRYPPVGFVSDGLIYFNLNGGVRTFVLLAFVLIWLPAMITVARAAGRDSVFKGLQNVLTSSFAALVLTTGLFLSARRSAVIVSLFVMIAVLFVLMTVVNVLIIKLHTKQGSVKHAARRAAK